MTDISPLPDFTFPLETDSRYEVDEVVATQVVPGALTLSLYHLAGGGPHRYAVVVEWEDGERLEQFTLTQTEAYALYRHEVAEHLRVLFGDDE